jgi:hypothetical protein
MALYFYFPTRFHFLCLIKHRCIFGFKCHTDDNWKIVLDDIHYCLLRRGHVYSVRCVLTFHVRPWPSRPVMKATDFFDTLVRDVAY